MITKIVAIFIFVLLNLGYLYTTIIQAVKKSEIIIYEMNKRSKELAKCQQEKCDQAYECNHVGRL